MPQRGETAVAQADGTSVIGSGWRNRTEPGSRALHHPPRPEGPLREQHTCGFKSVWDAQGTSLHRGSWHRCLEQNSKGIPTCWVQRVGTSPRMTEWHFPGSADSQPGWSTRCYGHTPGWCIPWKVLDQVWRGALRKLPATGATQSSPELGAGEGWGDHLLPAPSWPPGVEETSQTLPCTSSLKPPILSPHS